MCVICVFEPGVMPPFEKIENAVYNNEDGFGLIVKDVTKNKLQIIKSTEEDLKKDADPQAIFKLLEENIDFQRILHLRNKTEGAISEENVQPFCTYSTNKRQIYFMHNGTLYDFKPKSTSTIKYIDGVKTEENAETASDSKKFNDEFLAPLLLRISGEHGKADILDPVLQNLIAKFWGNGQHNRGILVCNDLDYVLINSSNWETIKVGEKEFIASNDQYFDKLIRGKEFDKRKKAKEEEDKQNRASRFQGHSKRADVTDIKDLNFKFKFKKLDNIDLASLMADSDIYTHSGLSALKNLGGNEIEQFIKFHPETAASLLVHITDEFSKLYENHNRLVKFQKEQKVG